MTRASLDRLLFRPTTERRLGPLHLVEPLGQGGFAPVWRAREMYGDTHVRDVAVKLFPLQTLGQSGELSPPSRKIVEEARALCRVQHPNVIRFHSLHFDEELEAVGLSMELAEGDNVDQRLAKSGAMPVLEVLDLGICVANALGAVHRAGLVHRDVKPSNIVHTDAGYRLIDFGVADEDVPQDSGQTKRRAAGGVTDEPDEEQTAEFAVHCGTRGYCDPAWYGGAPAVPESDLYALGATLFQCLTGRLPAATGTARGSLDPLVLEGRAPAPSLGSACPSAPRSLVRLVDALLAPDPAARAFSAERVAGELAQIRRSLRGKTPILPDEAIGPFRGLERFEAQHRGIHFGRSAETAATMEMLRDYGLAALVGPSGSGKSSLGRAAVLPSVADEGLGGWPKRWATAIATPGDDPRQSVLEALAPTITVPASRSPAEVLEALARRAQKTEEGILLFVDQLEEVATMASGASQAWCVELLARFGEQTTPGVRALVAVRRDLLDRLLAFRDLGGALARGTVLVEPLGASAWMDVLDQALGAYGYALEDRALGDRLLAEVGDTEEAMPLIQFAMTELWRHRDTKRRLLTHDALEQIGGIGGALERHANTTLRRIVADRPAGAEEDVRRLLLTLTTVHGTRSTQPEAALREGPGGGALEELARARLVVRTDHGITLAHEALLRQWDKLRHWVDEAQQDRLLAEELDRDAERWESDREGAPLWRRRRLSFAEELRRRAPEHLSERAAAFLEVCRRAERRRWLLAGAAAATAVALIAASTTAYVQSVRAQERKTQAALEREKDARSLAEQRTADLQRAQNEISELAAQLSNAPSKETIVALKRQIRRVQQSSLPAERRATNSAIRSPAVAPERAEPAPEPAPEPKRLKVQEEW